MTTVIATGTFDLFHDGHKSHLEQAKAMGKFLIVIVARDETVLQVKNRTPIHTEEERLRQVSQCECVDLAILGMRGDKLKVLDILEPDVLALGYDQLAFTTNIQQKLQERGLKTIVKRTIAHKPEKYKTSLLRLLL